MNMIVFLKVHTCVRLVQVDNFNMYFFQEYKILNKMWMLSLVEEYIQRAHHYKTFV